MTRKFALGLTAAAVILGTASPAWAHPGHPGHEFVDGWWHPLLGLDHLLAMVAVGLLAVRQGGRGLWLMPALFIGAMLLGGLAAAAGVLLPGVEWGIMASVLVLGLLVSAARQLPLWVGASLVTLFAVFHGLAHAAEMVDGGSLSQYAAGFVLSTATLHLGGIAAGLALASVGASDRGWRWTGGLISAASLLLVLGAI